MPQSVRSILNDELRVSPFSFSVTWHGMLTSFVLPSIVSSPAMAYPVVVFSTLVEVNVALGYFLTLKKSGDRRCFVSFVLSLASDAVSISTFSLSVVTSFPFTVAVPVNSLNVPECLPSDLVPTTSTGVLRVERELVLLGALLGGRRRGQGEADGERAG